MTKPMIRIHNISTNEIIDREMTDEEFVIHQADIEAKEAEQAVKETIAAQRQALLTRLGITEDEARLLLS